MDRNDARAEGRDNNLITTVRRAIEPFEEIVFALLFGSGASGRLREDSDLDVAVYVDSGGRLEVEEPREYAREAALQIAIERATDRNVDLLLLNSAPATVTSAAVLTGKRILVRNPGLSSRYFLAVTNVAIDFLWDQKEFRQIAERSTSLSELDRERLNRILQYIDEELPDRNRFARISGPEYHNDRDKRRLVDRWTEMLINAAIDIGKIVLAAEGRAVPPTYGRILQDLGGVDGFEHLSEDLVPLAPLRNIMSHEYLDLRYTRIHSFATKGADAVGDLASAARRWMVLPAAD